MSDPNRTPTVRPDEVEALTQMRLDVDHFDAFRADDVRVLLDIIDRLDRSERAALSTTPAPLDSSPFSEEAPTDAEAIRRDIALDALSTTPAPDREVLRDAGAFGHNLAVTGITKLGHSGTPESCPQRLCARVRAALEGDTHE